MTVTVHTREDLEKELFELRQKQWGVNRRRLMSYARFDPNVFIEQVIRDEDGNLLVQDPIHESWFRFMAYARRLGRHAGILAPFGHGKSLQMVGFAAYVVGRRPQVRVKYVSNKFDLAKQRVQAVRRIIEHSEEYHHVFPDVVPMRERKKSREEWAGARFRVKSTSGATDPTMEAFGVMATGTGSRADLIIFDDPTDMENTIHKPADRPKVYERIQGTWLPRLVGNAFAVAVMTRLHEADAAGQMLLNEGWAWLVQRVSDDYQSIQSEIVLPGWRGDKMPTWDGGKMRMVA